MAGSQIYIRLAADTGLILSRQELWRKCEEKAARRDVTKWQAIPVGGIKVPRACLWGCFPFMRYKKIKVELKERGYEIVVGNSILAILGKFITSLKIGNDAYIVSNPWIKKRYGVILSDSLRAEGLRLRFKLVPDKEESKSLQEACALINDLAAYAKHRRTFMIAFGGGVIGDLTGFVASVYKRGIAYLQVPTTLLAQVDSAIGGKTAVDLKQAKNLVGAFYQPRLVFSDVALLGSLDHRQLSSGLSEVIKYGIIKAPQLFTYLEKNYADILKADLMALEFIVNSCSRIKARIVQQDEQEGRGIRTILNFGHTIGHAIEAAGNYRGYNHGEAVALGMLAACTISVKLGLLSDNLSLRIKNLIGALRLPTKMKKVSQDAVLKAHYYDKKFIGPKNRLVLIAGLGKVKIVENVAVKLIQDCLQQLS